MKFEFISLLKKHSMNIEMLEKNNYTIRSCLEICTLLIYVLNLFKILNLTNSMTLLNGNLSSSLGHFFNKVYSIHKLKKIQSGLY